MSAKEIKITARRAYDEGWNDGVLQVFDEVYATDFVYHDSRSPDVHSRQDYKEWVAGIRSGWSDVHLIIEDIFAGEDKVAARGSMTGTQLETGKKAMWTWISVFRFVDGQIVELWNTYDSAGILEQLGIIPIQE